MFHGFISDLFLRQLQVLVRHTFKHLSENCLLAWRKAKKSFNTLSGKKNPGEK